MSSIHSKVSKVGKGSGESLSIARVLFLVSCGFGLILLFLYGYEFFFDHDHFANIVSDVSAANIPVDMLLIPVTGKYGGNMLHLEDDDTVYEVIPPEHLFEDKVVITSVICDPNGSCNTTGLVRRDIDYKRKIENACFLKDGAQIESKMTAIKYVKHKKKQVKVYAANTFFKVKFGAINGLQYGQKEQLSADQNNIEFRANCNLNETNVPVLLRSVRKFNNKIVLLVTQYYSEVSLHWMEVWLNHYFDIGVDIVALYAGFRTNEHEKYSKELHQLIQNDRFKDRVHFFKWDSISALQTWAHSQASMINHGASFFKGSVIVGADLDELVIPRVKPNLKDLAKYYDKRYGTWALQFQTYIIEANHHTKEKIDREIEKGTLNFGDWVKDAHECGGSPKMPWQCRAKTIFHSLDLMQQGIHTMHFDEVNYTESWLDSNVAVLLHLRGIQQHGWLEKYRNN